jgi:hypothetical protein
VDDRHGHGAEHVDAYNVASSSVETQFITLFLSPGLKRSSWRDNLEDFLPCTHPYHLHMFMHAHTHEHTYVCIYSHTCAHTHTCTHMNTKCTPALAA